MGARSRLIRSTGRSGAVDQDLAKVNVASLTDAEQLGLVSGRVLPQHNAQPRGELPALAKGSAVADGSNDGGCNHRPNAGVCRMRVKPASAAAIGSSAS